MKKQPTLLGTSVGFLKTTYESLRWNHISDMLIHQTRSDQVQFVFLDLDSLKQAGARPVLLLVKEYASSHNRNILKI